MEVLLSNVDYDNQRWINTEVEQMRVRVDSGTDALLDFDALVERWKKDNTDETRHDRYAEEWETIRMGAKEAILDYNQRFKEVASRFS